MDNVEADRRHYIAARRLLAIKLAVTKTLPNGYVSDPALVLLLNIFIMRADNASTTHRMVCEVATCVSASVADRWIKALAQDGLVVVTDPGVDQEERLVTLTQLGLDIVRATLVAVAKVERTIDEQDAAEPYVPALRLA